MKIASTSLLFMAISASAVSAINNDETSLRGSSSPAIVLASDAIADAVAGYKNAPPKKGKFDMIGRAFDDVVSEAKEDGIVDKAKIDAISSILGDLVNEQTAEITVNEDMFVESESTAQCISLKDKCSLNKQCCSGYCTWTFIGIGFCATCPQGLGNCL